MRRFKGTPRTRVGIEHVEHVDYLEFIYTQGAQGAQGAQGLRAGVCARQDMFRGGLRDEN